MRNKCKNGSRNLKKSRASGYNKRGAVTRSAPFFRGKKGFGDAASTLIMFIAVISVTTGLVVAFVNYVKSTEGSFQYQNKLTSNKLRTSIDITNVYYNETSKDLYIYIKNVGETKLITTNFDLFVDNGFTTNYTIYYADNLSKEMELFQLQQTAAMVYNIDLNSGSHTLRVNTEYGVGDEDYFNT